ncbi:MAG TPA: hypothetical protein VF260_00655 [Bacilli bacterium]
MLAPILSSKISVPPVEPRLLYRQRLAGHLENALINKISLITAPAGYGKTTLVSSWVAKIAVSVAWVSLEPDDNALARFWYYIAASLERI